MRKAVGTFVDHQEVVRYPVGLITEPYEDFDEIYWFGSDDENVELLESIKAAHPLRDRIAVVNLNQKIREPRDIGTAQTRSVKFMQRTGADIVGYQQADLCLTDDGIHEVIRELANATPTTAFSVSVMQNKLYCESYFTPHCCFFIGSGIEHNWSWGWENKWRKPGAEWRQFSSLDQDSTARLMIDLGYFDTASFYRKMVNHQRIWVNQPWVLEMQGLLETDMAAAVRYGIQRLWAEMRYEPEHKPRVVEYEGAYKKVIDRMGLYEDYCFVRSVVGE